MHGCVVLLLLRFLLLRFRAMVFNDCWCISFTLSAAGAAAANPIIGNRMEPLHAVPVIANYLLRSLNLHRVAADVVTTAGKLTNVVTIGAAAAAATDDNTAKEH